MQNREIKEDLYLLAQVDAKKKYLSFCPSIYKSRINIIPIWSGCNTQLSIYRGIPTYRSIPTKTKLCNLPVINAFLIEILTVNKILSRSEEIVYKLN